jgi:hypothetical protein
MRHSVALLSLIAALVAGCGKAQTARVPDVTKSTTLTLTTAPGQRAAVHSISMRIRGKIDGTAQISGLPLQPKRVSGEFEIAHNGDYYSTNCVISYLPVGVRKGRVTVDYEFRSSEKASR